MHTPQAKVKPTPEQRVERQEPRLELERSKHAGKRQQQRAISPVQQQLVWRFGEEWLDSASGAQIHWLSDRCAKLHAEEIEPLLRQGKIERDDWDRALHVALVERNGKLVTQYRTHSPKPSWRRA
jgi:hypothetical protein